MSMVQFFLLFGMLSVIGSLAIFGWYIVTRGEWYITPDGRWKKTGMIFKEWSLFFEQYREKKLSPFWGEGLKAKYEILSQTHPHIASKFSLQAASLKKIHSVVLDQEIKIIEQTLLCMSEWAKDDLLLATEEPVYDWPQWVQKPVSSCPTCMAGPYGTALWLVFIELQRDVFAWTDHIIFAKIAFGMLFLLTLATVNTFISKKIQV